ncbi:MULTISPECIES: pyrroline-5-carboxylate reductase [unclassified Leifsonia]|uniref:pyrroline-5-carboxylate reductase n=1 Tax=unclassified Leifsonia TaxID=2663824 RepID=UPI0008A810DC|nr:MULTISPECIES: pyrroline-5-carboxylate reductase [unclassified Leifsonia]SEH57844.1 pyrroline-5-carboxylate reductase [Leifsonia sp. CL154]SFL21090.1 pyrroline-5-carboxylate reductase [Leifsonia sp. CL147]
MDDAQNVTLPTIAMLGAGSMGRAILSGLLAPGVQVAGIRVTNRSAARAATLAGAPGVTAYATETRADANRLAVEGAQVVLVAVKPAMVRDLLAEISDSLAPGTVVVSVAAGVTAATMESLLPDSISVVRAMPNTPAVVGKAVTGVSAGSRTEPEDLSLVRTLFETVGEVVEVPESQLDALSTISGSGPAYVFLLIEALTEAAVQKGFTPAQAATLVNGTFLGAAELLVSSGEEPAELRRRVTSPNGTTERAIAVLAEADLPALFARATDAALARARALAAG